VAIDSQRTLKTPNGNVDSKSDEQSGTISSVQALCRAVMGISADIKLVFRALQELKDAVDSLDGDVQLSDDDFEDLSADENEESSEKPFEQS